MKRTMLDLVVTAFGLLTAAATALALALLDVKAGIAVFSLMWWFVIPIGAVICGFVGVSGYLAGARLLQYKPSGLFLFYVLAVSMGTYVLLYYFEYHFTVVEGHPLADAVPFGTFLVWVLGHQSYTIAPLHHFGSVSIGFFGYLVAVLQVIGFAVGGLAVYAYLWTEPFCERCHRFLRQAALIRRTKMYDKELLTRTYRQALDLLRQGNSSQACEIVSSFGDSWNSKATYQLQLNLRKCNRCPTESYFIEAGQREVEGKSFMKIGDLSSIGMFGPGAPPQQMDANG
jgi:hypothetical protein